MAKRSRQKRNRKNKATGAEAEAEALSVVSEQSQNLQGNDEIKQTSSNPPQRETKPRYGGLKLQKAVRMKLSKVDVGTYHRIEEQLRKFHASSDREYKFEEQLKKETRLLIHTLCNPMGMFSKSSGSGAKRRISVFKTRKTTSELGNDNFSLLKLSEESEKVLLNLFMQYPPGLGGPEEKLKLNGRKKMTKMGWNSWDDTFGKPVMNKEELAEKVKALSLRVQNEKNLAKINEQRSRLPIASYRDVILSEIENHQVVLISGETGCGKTTQVPQFLLDKMWETGQACKIVCTQPRRISATSVAERISEERGETVGGTVGYKIRLESQGGRGSSLMLCTNGILLRFLVSDGLAGSKQGCSSAVASSTLSQITHIVVDEIHERDHYSDFTLAILREMLPSYPHLRLVLMSATMDIERFSQYFGGCPIIQVPGFTYPVKTFYLEDVLSLLQYEEKSHSDTTLPSSSSEHKVALDEAIDLALSNDEFGALLELISSEGTSNVLNYQHSRTGVSPLMVFAAKGRVGDISMLLSLGADCLLKAQDGSTALDWAKRAEQAVAADAISRHLTNASSNLADKYLRRVNPKFVDIDLVEKLLMKICMDSKSGAILVFLPGWDDISRTKDRLLANKFFQNPRLFLVLPLHSMVPSAEQKKVFSHPPHGCRKIILSTNIAETAVTIDDVVYVIDSGRLKEKGYDPYNNVSTLQSSWVSKASAKQRAGRSGRCQPGFCYHLFSKLQAEQFPEFRIPELKRMPLEELCLQVKLLNPDYDIGEFLNRTLDPPVDESVRNAVAALKEIGALSKDEKLTELGKRLGYLPINPLISKMLFLAILLNCLDPALTLACASYYRDPFTLPMLPEERRKANNAKAQLAALYGGHSDQLAVIAAFECWKDAKTVSLQARFCSNNFLSYNTMRMLSHMRKQLQRELFLSGYVPSDKPSSTLNQNARDPGIVNALLVAGSYPRVGRVNPLSQNQRGYYLKTASGDKVRVHHQSKCSLTPLTTSKEVAIVVFNEMTSGDAGLQVKKCSIIGNLPLVLLANDIAVAPTKNGKGDKDSGNMTKEGSPDEGNAMSSADNPVVLIVDRWIAFKSTALEIAQMYCLRQRLSNAIFFKGLYPRRPVPPALASTVNAIACILSHEERLRISLASGSEGTPLISPESLFSRNGFDGTHSMNQSLPFLVPEQVPVSRGTLKTTHPSNQSSSDLVPEQSPVCTGPLEGTCSLDQSIPSLVPEQIPESQGIEHGTGPLSPAVPLSLPAKEALTGQSSGVDEPSGTPSKKRARSNR